MNNTIENCLIAYSIGVDLTMMSCETMPKMEIQCPRKHLNNKHIFAKQIGIILIIESCFSKHNFPEEREHVVWTSFCNNLVIVFQEIVLYQET